MIAILPPVRFCPRFKTEESDLLNPTSDTWRLFLHVFTASVWVGGQVVLAGIVPIIRSENRDLLSAVARQFARLSWAAFIMATLTGAWSVVEINVGDLSTEYQVVLFAKLLAAGMSAVAAVIHSLGNSKAAKGVGGAMALLFGLATMFLGELLQTGV